MIFTRIVLYCQEFDFQLIKPEILLIGSPLHMKMEIHSAINDTIYVPQIDTLDIFVLKPPVQTIEEKTTNGKKTTIQFTFLPFDTGEHIFPVMEISIRTSEELKVFQTVEIPLVIHSVLTDSTLALRDIAPPLRLRFGWRDYAALFFVLSILVALILLTRKLLRKKEIAISEPIINDNRAAYLKALELLEQTKAKKLLENGKFLQFHFEISYILRFFIEYEFKINSMEMTTFEIRENLIIDNTKEKSEILDFLRFADRVKFAKFTPEYEQSKSALLWLEHYLLSKKMSTGKENLNV